MNDTTPRHSHSRRQKKRTAAVGSLGVQGLAVAAALWTAACGGASSPSPTAPTSTSSVSFLSVSLVPPDLLPGESVDASAWGWTRPNGNPIYGPVTVSAWTTSNPSVATVSSAGRVTAIASGTANITANALGASAAGVVTVFSENDVSALEVTCTATVSLRQGGECSAQARTRTGRTVQVQATWSSSRPDILFVLSGSAPARRTLLQGLSSGQSVVTATFGVFQAASTVVVAS